MRANHHPDRWSAAGQAKSRAARSGRTLSAVIEDALRESFRRSEEGRAAPPHFTTYRATAG